MPNPTMTELDEGLPVATREVSVNGCVAPGCRAVIGIQRWLNHARAVLLIMAFAFPTFTCIRGGDDPGDYGGGIAGGLDSPLGVSWGRDWGTSGEPSEHVLQMPRDPEGLFPPTESTPSFSSFSGSFSGC